MASSISAAREDIYARLVAAQATTLAGVQVTHGPPAATEEQEVVALMGVLDPDEQAAALGNRRRDERYRVEVIVKALDPSSDASTVDARGWAIADAVHEVIHGSTAGITLGGLVVNAEVVSRTSDGAWPLEKGGHVIFVRVLIAIHSRIT